MRSIRVKFAMASAAALLLAGAAMAAFSLIQEKQILDVALARELASKYGALRLALRHEQRAALELATAMSTTPGLAAAVAAGDRDRSLAILQRTADEAKAKFGINLVTLVTPPASIFLRVHDPKSFVGDDLSARRPAIPQVVSSAKARTSLEQSRSGLAAFGTAPLVHDGVVVGAVDVGEVLDQAFVAALRATFGAELTVHVRDGAGVKVLSSTVERPAALGAAEFAAALAADDGLVRAPDSGSAQARVIGPVADESGKPVAVVQIDTDVSELMDLAWRTRAMLVAAAAAALLLGSLLAFLIAGTLSGPLTRLTALMKRLSSGDADFEVPAKERADEIGDMARALDVFQANEIERRRLWERDEAEARRAAERSSRMALATSEFQAKVSPVLAAFDGTSQALHAASGTLSGTAERARELTRMVGHATERVASSISMAASAGDALKALAADVSARVTETAELAADAGRTSDLGSRRIETLSHKMQRIGEIVRLIGDVAAQTNLLALNATIEAARAGEAGRGFAVVANEVKNLALRTRHAAEEIAGQIGDAQSESGDAVAAFAAIREVVNRCESVSGLLAAGARQQDAAVAEIARGIAVAAGDAQDTLVRIREVANGADQTGRMAEAVLETSQRLRCDEGELRICIEQFIRVADRLAAGASD